MQKLDIVNRGSSKKGVKQSPRTEVVRPALAKVQQGAGGERVFSERSLSKW